ncbi:MAG: hypothetical protein AAFN92_02405 [Bacteroidota bacterium]
MQLLHLSPAISYYLCDMDDRGHSPQPPPWLGLLSWLPVITYFVVKYAIIGREQITSRQSWLLIAAVILAEIALWQYRKQFRKPPPENEHPHGTD